MRRFITLVFALSLIAVSCTPPDKTRRAKAQLKSVADAYLAETLKARPEVAYFVGMDLDRHDGLTNISPKGQQAWQKFEEVQLKALYAINEEALKGTHEWVLWGQLREMLEASIGLRVCRLELWGVNHMGGFHSTLTQIAERQPVGTPKLREQALRRWAKIDGLITDEIANLKRGIELGYLAPKNAVTRVIQQVDGLLGVPEDQSPLFAPARGNEDVAFKEAFSQLVRDQVLPAFRRYRYFLEEEYFASAREAKSLSANPRGRECYIASYRSYTTLNLTPEEVYERGLAIVNGYKADVVEFGKQYYGLDQFEAVIKANSNDPANQIASEEAMVAMFDNVVARAEEATATVITTMPEARVVVKPYPDFMAGTGMSARYEMAQGEDPAVFRFDPSTWDGQTVGSSEIVSVHEAWPGHHLQISIASKLDQVHPVQGLVFNSAYIEGWARYSEALAEEVGIYSSHHGPIARRAWPARGMVVDSGVHALGWSDQKALDFLKESGRFGDEAGPRMLDRISVIPAQLTAYDSGASEIFALRALAEQELGDSFDLGVFHQKVLENGIIPLWMLRQIIEEWVAEETAG